MATSSTRKRSSGKASVAAPPASKTGDVVAEQDGAAPQGDQPEQAAATKPAPVEQLPEKDAIPNVAALSKALLAAIKKGVKNAEQANPATPDASHYTRLRHGTTTLAYVFQAKNGVKVDLYVPADLKLAADQAKLFAPGRGRARKEGYITLLTSDAQIEKVVAAVKVVADAAAAPKK